MIRIGYGTLQGGQLAIIAPMGFAGSRGVRITNLSTDTLILTNIDSRSQGQEYLPPGMQMIYLSIDATATSTIAGVSESAASLQQSVLIEWSTDPTVDFIGTYPAVVAEFASGPSTPSHVIVDSGTVSVDNFPAVQTVDVDNFPAVQTVDVDNFPAFPATQDVHVTNVPHVDVDNFPATQTVDVDNFPATQDVHVTNVPHVDVDNFPAVQPVTFPTPQHVDIDNFPATQNVAVTNTPNVAFAAAQHVIVNSASATLPVNFPTPQHVDVDNFPATQPVTTATEVTTTTIGAASADIQLVAASGLNKPLAGWYFNNNSATAIATFALYLGTASTAPRIVGNVTLQANGNQIFSLPFPLDITAGVFLHVVAGTVSGSFWQTA